MGRAAVFVAVAIFFSQLTAALYERCVVTGNRDSLADSLHDLITDFAGRRWDWFCLDGVPYHGRDVTIAWDRSGKHYSCGAGLAFWVDGQEIARSPTLRRLTGKLPTSGAAN